MCPFVRNYLVKIDRLYGLWSSINPCSSNDFISLKNRMVILLSKKVVIFN